LQNEPNFLDDFKQLGALRSHPPRLRLSKIKAPLPRGM
jgi:hypothetical protein